jgi:hypothetical protein
MERMDTPAEAIALPVTWAMVPDAGYPSGIMLVNLTTQIWLDGVDRPRPQILPRNDVVDDVLPQDTSPVMA